MDRFQDWMSALDPKDWDPDALDARLRRRAGAPRILAGMGWGTADQLTVHGHVVEETGPVPGESLAGVLLDLLRGRADTPISGVLVAARCGGREATTTTGDDGAFDLRIPGEGLDRRGTHKVTLTLPRYGVETEVEVRVPRRDARFAILTTLDGAVLPLRGPDLLQAVGQMVETGAPPPTHFPGVGALLTILRRDVMAQPRNPLLYTGAVPADHRELLHAILTRQDLPPGPMLLADDDPRTDRVRALRAVLEAYPDLDVLLIGDQALDADAFLEIAETYPGRVLAAALRGDRPSHPATGRLAARVDTVLAPDAVAFAEHARSRGWIRERDLPRIRSARNQDLEAAEERGALQGAA